MLAEHKNTKAECGTEQTTVPYSAFKDEWQYGSAAKTECLPGAAEQDWSVAVLGTSPNLQPLLFNPGCVMCWIM